MTESVPFGIMVFTDEVRESNGLIQQEPGHDRIKKNCAGAGTDEATMQCVALRFDKSLPVGRFLHRASSLR